MSSRAERMYGKSPTMKRGEDGDMEISRIEKDSKKAGNDETMKETDNHEVMPAHVRHVKERHDMHSRHEHEHAMHDAKGHKDKEDMHGRHEKEMKEMHNRHEKELGETEHQKEMQSHEKKDKVLDKATKGGEKEGND